MQLRTIAFVFSIVGILYSSFTAALGLGEITLKSQFNQPLNAEIRLLKVRDLSKVEILTGLASREDFKLVGVDRLFFLSSFDFEVILEDRSNPFIKVTSSKSITEPYLNFLVEVQWPSGRLLREYTLLLDLPVFNEAGANAPVILPSSDAVAYPVQVSPAPKISQPKALVFAPNANPEVFEQAPKVTPPPAISSLRADSTPSAVRASNVDVDDYEVKSGDTLWKITEAALADSSASVNQKMIAILQANPNAFIKGNINRLKNGRVLRIPTNEEVANVGYQQALDLVGGQNQAWSAEKKSAQKAVLTSIVPTKSVTPEAAPVEGRLTLGSADPGQASVKGIGASGSGESLQNELAIANDELSRSTRQNEELSLRVSELEAQIETMESLVSVTSDQLKALELTSKNSIDTDVSETDAELTIASVKPLVDQDEVNSEASAPEILAAVEKPAVFVVPEPATSSDFTADQQSSLTDTVVDFLKVNMLLVGGALLTFLVAILVLLRLKKKPEDELEEFALNAGDEDLFDLNEDNLDDFNVLDDQAYAEDNTFSVDENIDESVQAQTEDVVAEADIYVSLGQEDKAIELLEKEIQQNPDNADARLGLLKIYAKFQNSMGFDEQYVQLLPLGNVYANDQAMTLRKEIENAEPFDTDQYSLKDDGLNFLDEVDSSDSDLDINEVVGSDNEGSIAFSGTVSDFDLDELSLDLDDLADEVPDVRENKSSSELTDTDFSLDFEELVDDLPSDLDDELIVAAEIDDELDDSLTLEDTVAKSKVDDKGLYQGLENDFTLDLDDDPNSSSNLADISLDDGLGNDFSVQIDEDDDSDVNVFEFDIPADDSEDLSLSLDDDIDSFDLDTQLDVETADEINAANSGVDADDSLDLDSPPPTDIDMASLDKEIEAMTADIDALSGDESEGVEPTEASETLNLEADNEPDLRRDQDTSTASNLNISDANDDAVVTADDELNFFEESDEVSTKLDLAKAYIDMGDREGAEDILNEVMEEGDERQKSDAKVLIENL
jgi:pilus assembly protein FimV